MTPNEQIIEEVLLNSGIVLSREKEAFRELCFKYGMERQADTANACYDKRNNKIYMNCSLDSAYGMSTFFHEVAHATKIVGDCPRRYNAETEECIAEATSILLMKHVQLATLETEARSEQYLITWFNPFFVSELVVKKESEKAAAYIIEHWLPKFNANRAAA